MKSALLICTLALGMLACTPPPPDCTEGEGVTSITPGFTGIAVCDKVEGSPTGSCNTFDRECVVDHECFEPLGEGDARVIPTWLRPQGGLGTRLNVRLEGVPGSSSAVGLPASSNAEDYASLRSLFIGEFEDDGGAHKSCDRDLCICNRSPAEGPCTSEDLPNCECNVNAGFECARDVPVDGDVCAVVIGDQVNRQFPLVCSTDGTVHIEEMPIQFRSRYRILDELDGVALTVFSIMTEENGREVFGSAEVTLDAGEFVPPSWFELGAPQPR